MSRKLNAVLCALFLAHAVFAESVADKKPSEDEKPSLEKQAVAFLRETMADVNSMRSAENRISFSSEMAGLMWFQDEREARAMYMSVISDFRGLLEKYSAELTSLGPTAEDDGDSAQSFGGLFGSPDPTDRMRVLRKITAAMAVRQQIALGIAEHDPDLAYSFFTETVLAIPSREAQALLKVRDAYFESQLIAQIANKSPEKAMKLASKSLSDGVDYQHIDLLRKLYNKDAEKAAEFGESILSALGASGDKTSSYVVHSLIEFGEDTLEKSKKPDGKKATFSHSDLRRMAEMLANRALELKTDDDDDGMGEPSEYLKTIEKYSPGKAVQIKAKYKIANTPDRSAANRALANAAKFASNSATSADRRKEEEAKAEKQLMDDIGKFSSKELPKEERDKFITNSRKIIMQNRSRDKKIVALSALAAQVSKLGDKELADQIMKEAEALVNPSPKNYHDFLLTWMLATGFASTDPNRAFSLLDDTIGRANETLAAFVKVGEFIDVAEQMISDGEVQVGAFGGQMVRGLTSELGVAESTINVLANTDFVRTKNLTNRFERPEVRILAKMMVLRAVLKKKEIPTDLKKDTSITVNK